MLVHSLFIQIDRIIVIVIVIVIIQGLIIRLSRSLPETAGRLVGLEPDHLNKYTTPWCIFHIIIEMDFGSP